MILFNRSNIDDLMILIYIYLFIFVFLDELPLTTPPNEVDIDAGLGNIFSDM